MRTNVRKHRMYLALAVILVCGCRTALCEEEPKPDQPAPATAAQPYLLTLVIYNKTKVYANEQLVPMTWSEVEDFAEEKARAGLVVRAVATSPDQAFKTSGSFQTVRTACRKHLLLPESDEQKRAQINTISEIEIRGSILTHNDMKLLLQSKVGSSYSANTWQDDLKKLRSSGLFLEVRDSKPVRNERGIKLVAEVVEPPTITKLRFKGKRGLDETVLMKSIKTLPYRGYFPAQAEADARILETLYVQMYHEPVRVRWEAKPSEKDANDVELTARFEKLKQNAPTGPAEGAEDPRDPAQSNFAR